MITLVDSIDHFCGKCHELIKKGSKYVLLSDEYRLPCGKMRRREFPVHENCAKPEEKLNGVVS